ncbi:MAG: hypothetical protein JW793_13275 [Acidobacteria bacterium]|nr:hypothetical protein [Acidobacteriota bacterium]
MKTTIDKAGIVVIPAAIRACPRSRMRRRATDRTAHGGEKGSAGYRPRGAGCPRAEPIAEIARHSGARTVVTDNRRHISILMKHGVRVLRAEEYAAELC